MNENPHQPLFDRLEALVDRNSHPDWQDVVRRSGIARAPRSRRSQLTRRLVPVVALAAAVVAVGLIAPWRHGPSLIDRALAAIGNGPVIHGVILVPKGNGFTYIDLATGKETPQSIRCEFWLDEQRNLMHVAIKYGDQLVQDKLVSDPLSPSSMSFDPGIAGISTRYRSALASGDARVISGAEKVVKADGSDVAVYWIEFPIASTGYSERVAVDRKTSLPVLLEWCAKEVPVETVDIVSVETLPEGGGDFTVEKTPPHSTTITGRSSQTSPTSISPADAAKALPGALWAGESVSGLSLSDLSRSTLGSSDIGIEIRYGDGWPYGSDSSAFLPNRPLAGVVLGRAYAWLAETKAALSPYGQFNGMGLEPGSVLTKCYEPELPRYENNGTTGCEGYMETDGVYVYLRASTRDLLVSTARALQSIRP